MSHPVEPEGNRASQELFSSLYRELHRLAKNQIARQRASELVGATTLLHEAYLSLSRQHAAEFPDRAHFMAYASRAMRGLVIDFARRKQARKRGGEFVLTNIEQGELDQLPDVQRLTQLSEELDQLSAVDPKLSEIVDLKFFCGLSLAEIAELRGVSESTVRRDWEKARIYLHEALQNG
jgi:RNA polymerase sigma factor (TIGR02999 family)